MRVISVHLALSVATCLGLLSAAVWSGWGQAHAPQQATIHLSGEGTVSLDVAEARLLQELPNDKYGELVRQGFRIFTDTPRFAGRYTGNALSCTNCHLDGGRRADAAPMWAAWGMYPAYLAKTERVNTFEERIQQCFRFSMNGFPPPIDSREISALVAYAQWTARGMPIRVNLAGRGFPTVGRTGADPNALAGRSLYTARCAACHGKDGEGQQVADGAYLYPPLWGASSFNDGAGFSRIDLLAGFVKANMPYGDASLSDQEAWDVAAWIALQTRWPDPRKGALAGLFGR